MTATSTAKTKIDPLVTIEIAGWIKPAQPGGITHGRYTVHCRECGDVTRMESGGTVNDAPLAQCGLYQQRHLAKHLKALAEEIALASR